MKETGESVNAADSGGTPPKPNLTWARLLVYAGLLLLSLALTGSFLRPDQCQTRGCSPYSDSLLLDGDLLPDDALRVTMQGQEAYVWIELGDTAVYTPSITAQGLTLKTDDGQTIPYLDELAANGYMAIRVPHAPPTYTLSSLQPGMPPGQPEPLRFSYYSPPSTDTATTIPVSITRRADLEAVVNTQYPIVDGQSHWEVWWLPEGETFPIPDQPFRVDADAWPDTLQLQFRIDFGDGSSAADCAGCPVEILVYNGYIFAGPYPFALRYGDPEIHEPLVSFGVHCAYQATPSYPTVVQYISPTVPFTHVYCLENWDTVTRTFTINAASSQDWDYAYYWQGTQAGATPNPVSDPPFTVKVGPPPNGWEPGQLGLLAIHTPTIVVSDTMRETLYMTATSTVSSEVKASSLSVALAPGYTLDEGALPPQVSIYLPLILRND
jgi:hypothetical protein